MPGNRHSYRDKSRLILIKSLESPLRQIATNAGFEDATIIDKLRNSKSKYFGFDALNEKYTDMIADGIIDPTKVVRIALQNAASVAGLLLTTEGLVSEIKEEEKHAPAMPPGRRDVLRINNLYQR